jgi:hypothetical protein
MDDVSLERYTRCPGALANINLLDVLDRTTNPVYFFCHNYEIFNLSLLVGHNSRTNRTTHSVHQLTPAHQVSSEE